MPSTMLNWKKHTKRPRHLAGDISATDAAAGTIGTKDINTGFKNERKGTIPTGLAYTVFPGAVAVLLGGAGATFVMKKKREN